VTFPRRFALFLCAATAVGSAALTVVLSTSSGREQSAFAGDTVNRAVPPLTLESETGTPMTLAAFRGRVVVLAPFLTLCHEVCPLTTGAFDTLHRDLARAGLANGAVLVEVSVDPWRDTPRRLLSFARMTKTRFPLLTGTDAQLRRFWRFFGVAFWRTKEGRPPDTDWLTGRPLTFDVNHTDGLFLIDGRGRERIVDVGMPDVGGQLPRGLERLLNAQGRADLAQPRPGWTPQQVLVDLERLLGKQIPAARAIDQ